MLRYLALAIATMVAGLILRLAPLGLPFLLSKWGGSVLWAVMVYWLAALLLPFRRVLTVALVAGIFAGLVELIRLYHAPGLDAFRLALAGALLLGSVFSQWHLIAYWVSIGVAAGTDKLFLRAKSSN